MSEEYVKCLEEEIVSLKNLLDERTKELDLVSKERDSIKEAWKLHFGASSNTDTSDIKYTTITIDNPFIGIGNVSLTEDDIRNLHHLWNIHIQRENNPPLLYRIWRKIVSCLTTKKN
jgi:hypothetical protein